uniref:uncharacterized protein K02A2.6-like n=1 Tax=Anopheles coluzzii TaxID=1518534 RepID=UPI0020FFB3CB|nr:uncharacterized protein K02A2.6-like [Anopheles coluzzii]
MLNPDEMMEEEEHRRLSQNWGGNAVFGNGQQQPSQSNVALPAQPPLQNVVGAPSQQGASTSGQDAGMLSQMLKLLQQQMNQQQQLMAQMLKYQQQSVPQPSQPSLIPTNPELIIDALASNISEFRYEAESGATFKAWYERYEDLFLRDASRLDDGAKVRLLGRKLGTAEHARFTSFILPRAPRELTFDETVAKLTALFGRTESLLSKRYKCMQITKAPREDLLTFSCRVNRACVDFEFAGMNEEQFKCLILVCGLKEEVDSDMRNRLLARIEEKHDVTLEQLSAECQRITNIKVDSALIANESGERVLAVNSGGYRQKQFQFNRQQYQSYGQPTQAHARANDNTMSVQKPLNACWLCSGPHWKRECPYRSHECADCGRLGHREGHCEVVNRFQRRGYNKKGTNVATRVVNINVCDVEARRKYVHILINGRPTKLQLDTASDITVISEGLWKDIGQPSLIRATVKAKAASQEYLELMGEFEALLTIASRTQKAVVRVAYANLLLLGADVVESFSLGSIPMDHYCSSIDAESATQMTWEERFPTVFRGMGLCTKSSIKLKVKEGSRPIFRPKRPVAYAMLKTVDEELDRLETLNVITPVDYSEWAAPIVVVRKANGKIRICGDYSTGLNDLLQSHEYPLPLPEDIFAKLSKCRIFSKIDLSDAFLQVQIDKEYRPLLTINTHRGLYHYNRLPPGIKIAPAAFQQLIDTMLAGLSGVCGYMDDLIIGGLTDEDHDKTLGQVLKRIEEFGFTLRADKCVFRMCQIKYLGHVIDGRGIRPDPEKISSIQNLPPPTDIAGVRSFLGAINYYGKFIPMMRDLRFPLDSLLKDEKQFKWTKECEAAFMKFKEVLSSELLLTHYDPSAEIIVAADASSVGIGATLSHKFSDGSIKVVQHASRALTKAESNYSQIDREGLALVYAVTKFHKMLYGRHFRLQTDHRPLLRIFGSKKGIPIYTASRLQRFALTMQLYDFTIEYVQSGMFGNADILSRLIRNHAKPEAEYVIASLNLEEDLRSVAINAISNSSPLCFRDVERSTQADPLLRKVYLYIQEGWPRDATFGSELARFHVRSEALSTVEGCILFGERLVIPEDLRAHCLEQLHRGHPGVERMKSLARSYVYWPRLDDEIVQYVAACEACAAAAKSPPQAKPTPWPKPSGPWQRLHVDYAGPILGDYFLVVVDAFSKWPEIVKTSTTTSRATVAILRGLFARFGMPLSIVSDNGPQFTSQEFKNFCECHGIRQVTTAPFHPQSNGQAERFVDTLKRALKKIQTGGTSMDEALDTFLQAYRTTPNPALEGNTTPAEIIVKYPVRTHLELLRRPPVVEEETEITAAGLQPGDVVATKKYYQNTWKWISAEVLRRLGTVMYELTSRDGRIMRRHIDQIRKRSVKEPHQLVQDSETPTQLPIDILLGEWSLTVPNEPLPLSSTTEELRTVPSPQPFSPAQVAPSESNHRKIRSPRRSSRNRKLPRRFDAFIL